MIIPVKNIQQFFQKKKVEPYKRINLRGVPHITIEEGVFLPLSENSKLLVTPELLEQWIQEDRVEYRGGHYYFENKQRVYGENLPQPSEDVVEIHNMEELRPYLQQNGSELYVSDTTEGSL